MDNIIQGTPSKTFFIEMITRDISIKDAILDLIDNSIDGANKLNETDYSGLYIKLVINQSEFVIEDNCGGFSLDIAKKYAFRFGRPDDAPESKGSIGRFGIGMKRALFKIGNVFEVESKTEHNHFQINVNVAEWKNKFKTITDKNKNIKIEDWDFTYSDITEETRNLQQNGTYIKVHSLNKEVSDIFNNEFLNALRNDIQRLLNFSLEKGISIILNGCPLESKNLSIFRGQSQPYYFNTQRNHVKIKIFAGIAEVGEPKKSGWYIYCNDRLVVEADQSELTGWNTQSIPKWHMDYVMFRGIVFMDSDDTFNLPLTTTKKGIDSTSDVYKVALQQMREATLSILPFMKNVAKLGNEANEYRLLLGEQEEKINVVELKSTTLSHDSKRFISPVLNLEKIAQKKDWVRVSYSIKKSVGEEAKLSSGSKSFSELGQYTFNYYLEMEGIDNE
ncbi:ATP-binding protein [Sphingobacterium thalpophilum]|uniref:ATP-binding protein n=1 Tax=Sphingobacterium thalpophilum TaxID=259 RepID=UPI0024A6E401|nr:ATP-binding protein [Sphingobacterium thalpophilum]